MENPSEKHVQIDNNDSDDEPSLPADTIAILNEFLREQTVDESKENADNVDGTEKVFGENWVS